MNEKKVVRIAMRALRAALDPSDKAEHDQAICSQLAAVIQHRDARIIHTFLPMADEVDIFPLITTLLGRPEIILVSPKVLPGRKLSHWVLHSLEDLENGVFGTKHPVNISEYTGTYDLILVPGLAFDRAGNRLGYGQGFYDFFLKDHPEAYKIGIAYPFQILEKLPVEPHDVPLDEVLF